MTYDSAEADGNHYHVYINDIGAEWTPYMIPIYPITPHSVGEGTPFDLHDSIDNDARAGDLMQNSSYGKAVNFRPEEVNIIQWVIEAPLTLDFSDPNPYISPGAGELYVDDIWFHPKDQ
jgi:hypothetical protein